MRKITARARVLIDEIIKDNRPLPNDLTIKQAKGLSGSVEVYHVNTKINGNQCTILVIHIENQSAALHEDRRTMIPDYQESLGPKPKCTQSATPNNSGRYSSQWKKLIDGVMGRTNLPITGYELGHSADSSLVTRIELTVTDHFGYPKMITMTIAETRAEQRAKNTPLSDLEKLYTIPVYWPPQSKITKVAEELASKLSNRYDHWPKPPRYHK